MTARTTVDSLKGVGAAEDSTKVAFGGGTRQYDGLKADVASLEHKVDELIQAKKGEFFEQLTLSLISAVIGAVLVLLARRVLLNVELSFKRRPERKLLIAELKELHRHFEANTLVLEKLSSMLEGEGLAGKRLSPLHFEKLKANEDGIFFDPQALRLLNEQDMKVALLAKVRLRNRNLEAQRVVGYLSEGNYDPPTLRQYLEELIEQHVVIDTWLAKVIRSYDADWEPEAKEKATESSARLADLERLESIRARIESERSKHESTANTRKRHYHVEPEVPPSYPKVEAVDLEKLADLVSARISKDRQKDQDRPAGS